MLQKPRKYSNKAKKFPYNKKLVGKLWRSLSSHVNKKRSRLIRSFTAKSRRRLIWSPLRYMKKSRGKSRENQWCRKPLRSPWQPSVSSPSELRAGDVVTVEVLLIRHTYDVVWQDTGALETGVDAARLSRVMRVAGDHIFMPGDKVIHKAGLFDLSKCHFLCL